jgi:hypothetical protein
MNNNKDLSEYFYFYFNIIDNIIYTYNTRTLLCTYYANVPMPGIPFVDEDQQKAIDTQQGSCYHARI